MALSENRSGKEVRHRHAAELRRELSARNLERAREYVHEQTYGQVPSVIYCEDEGGMHGNFLDASYRRICVSADWRRRLEKVYTASRCVPHPKDRKRLELACASSSDALLMNVFVIPAFWGEHRCARYWA